MKKCFWFIVMFFMALRIQAQSVWTVQTLPNTRLESDAIHVSDPDGYLSDSAEMNINTALSAIREQADVFVVTIGSIGEEEPKRFATQLFNYWGIGDADADNGVLLLFVEDQHALEFETGYGAEETLTDALCQRIFTQTIVPYFRDGDYEGGLCAGVGEIVSIYGGEIPMGLVTTLPATNYEDEEIDDIGFFFLLLALFMFGMPVVGLMFWQYKRNKKNSSVSDTCHSFNEGGATYVDDAKVVWTGSPWEGKGCLGGLMLGFSIFVFLFIALFFRYICFPEMEENQIFDWVAIVTLVLYFSWICFRQNHRVLKTADSLAKQSLHPKEVYVAAFNNSGTKIATWMAPWLGWYYRRKLKKRMDQSIDIQCPICYSGMKTDRSFPLPENHALERKLQIYEFSPYHCTNGHTIVLRKQGALYKNYITCNKCGMLASKLTKTETIREASYTLNGEKQQTFVCQHCGDTVKKTVVIPKLVHYTSSSSSSYSSSSSHRSYSSRSSSRSSGSFGGGRSGGGGYSGRW